MKNLLISGLVIGSLIACPVAFTDEPAQTVEQTEQQKAAPVKKKAHAKKTRCKHRGKCHHKQRAKQMSSTETPAEKKIDEETELTNR